MVPSVLLARSGNSRRGKRQRVQQVEDMGCVHMHVVLAQSLTSFDAGCSSLTLQLAVPLVSSVVRTTNPATVHHDMQGYLPHGVLLLLSCQHVTNTSTKIACSTTYMTETGLELVLELQGQRLMCTPGTASCHLTCMSMSTSI